MSDDTQTQEPQVDAPAILTSEKDKKVVALDLSDMHCGGTTALCPEYIKLDDGGEYWASKPQNWIRQCYETTVDAADKLRKKLNARLIFIFNGDMVEGHHHHTTQVLSGNPNAQAHIVDAMMKIPLALGPDAIFIVRGTGAHTGPSSASEERIATGLMKNGDPIVGDPELGTNSHWHLRLKIHGVRVDVAHHGRTGMREHTRGGAAVLYAHDIMLAHIKSGDEYPHLCLRAHHHKFNDSYDAAPTRVLTTGAWQLSTEYGHKVSPDSLSDIGGALITFDKDEGYEVKKMKFEPSRSTVFDLTA